jgi:hypothetical protein
MGLALMPSISREKLIYEASLLKSEQGENPEYDRALCELIYWAFDPLEAKKPQAGIEAVYKEVGIVRKEK